LFITKIILLKVVHPLKIYQNTQFHGPTLSERPPLWNGCSYSIKNYGGQVTFNGTTTLLNFIENIPIGSEGETGGYTDRMVISLTFFPL
jgi:hypothetical protein